MVVLNRQLCPNWSRVNAVSVRILAGFFFVEVTSWSSSTYGNAREPEIAKTILKKKRIGGLVLPVFKTFYQATVIKTVEYGHKDSHIGQWNRIETLELNSYKFIGDWFSTMVPTNSVGSDNLFNKQCGFIEHPCAKKKFTSCTKKSTQSRS